MKKIFFMAALAIVIALGMSALPKITKADSLGAQLSGRVLLAVQANGETWYVNPVNQQRYFLGQSLDALNIMQQLGLGISNKDFDSFKGQAPLRLSGRILIKVEDLGEAYYVNPLDLKMNYLGTPSEALDLFQSFGLGITNSDLARLAIPQNWGVNITESGFNPATLTVTRGAMITWTNNDSVVHTVTSPNNFNFGDINPGKTYSRMFNIAGTYNYYCRYHPNMKGVIIVK